MRVESPFFEKSSVCFILERSRGLEILTFDKIKKVANCKYFEQNVIRLSEIVLLLSKMDDPVFFVFKFFVMGLFDTAFNLYGIMVWNVYPKWIQTGS